MAFLIPARLEIRLTTYLKVSTLIRRIGLRSVTNKEESNLQFFYQTDIFPMLASTTYFSRSHTMNQVID